jgi:hypothetical protein
VDCVYGSRRFLTLTEEVWTTLSFLGQESGTDRLSYLWEYTDIGNKQPMGLIAELQHAGTKACEAISQCNLLRGDVGILVYTVIG